MIFKQNNILHVHGVCQDMQKYHLIINKVYDYV